MHTVRGCAASPTSNNYVHYSFAEKFVVTFSRKQFTSPLGALCVGGRQAPLAMPLLLFLCLSKNVILKMYISHFHTSHILKKGSCSPRCTALCVGVRQAPLAMPLSHSYLLPLPPSHLSNKQKLKEPPYLLKHDFTARGPLSMGEMFNADIK